MEHPAVVSANPADYTPVLVRPPGTRRPHVDAIGQVGDTVYIGGLFTRIARPGGVTQYTKGHFAAFDANTGVLRTEVVSSYSEPIFNGPIRDIETFDGSVYVAGEFTTVNGLMRPAVVKLDAATGAVDLAFNAGFQGGIARDLLIWNGPDGGTPMLIVTGNMGRKLYALDPDTGANTGYLNSIRIRDAIPGAWGGVSVYRVAINPAGDTMVAIGNFQTVNGQARTRLFVANLGPSGPILNDWYYEGFLKPCETDQPRRVAYLVGVDFPPEGDYFFLAATGFHSREGDLWPDGPNQPLTLCDGVGRFNLDDDTQPAWIHYTGGDSLWTVAATGAAVYVQGHNRWMNNPFGQDSMGPGAVWRRGLAAVHPDTGALLPWNPNMPAQMGGTAFLVTQDGLWVGSDSERFRNEPHRGIAFVPLP
jgi:hypothetical protein